MIVVIAMAYFCIDYIFVLCDDLELEFFSEYLSILVRVFYRI